MSKHLLLFILILAVCTNVFAQQTKSISGVVYDSNTGEALIGVSVLEVGTTNGTITDFDCRDALKLSSNKFSFSYVGFKTEIVNVTNSGTYNVNLVSDNKLDEVVVIGYGTQRKSDLTGALASISSKDIKNYAVSNASELLTGKAAGVFVAASSGQPGSDAVIRVRGLGTVNDNNPLYVVDGQFMDNISSLNPSDIERMEVLKDASACAIYGSRGSNGVILITTKGGVKGETTVTLDAYVGVKNSYKALNMMNSDQYYNFIMKAYENDASFQNSMKDKFTNQYQKGYNTNWWNEVTRTAFNQNYNLSIRKGTDNSRSSLSLGYVDDQGAIITTEFKRLSLKANLEYDINKFITVGANVNLAKIRKRDAGAIPSFDFIQKADPFTPVISPLVDPSSENYEYNKYAPTEWSYDPNPVAMLELPNRYNDIFNVFGNVFAQIKLYKGLSYRVQYSFERYHDTFKDFRPVYSSTFSEDNLANQESKYNKETQLNNNSAVTSNYQVEQRLNYNTTIGRHKLDAMVAMTYEKNSSEGINAFKRKALGNDEIYQILDAQTAGDNTSGGKETSSMLSYLGRINYVYDDRYLATVNFRADGSSRFAKRNRWGYFPSVSLGWRVSNEEFFKNLNIENTISNLKLRVGWGQNGNQRIDRDAPLTLIGTNNENQWYFGNGYSQGYVPTYVGNADIKWETSQQTNVGLDMSFFKNRLAMTVDVYRKKTTDLLIEKNAALATGYEKGWANIGAVRNQGIEITLDATPILTKKWNWTLNANIGFNRSKVLDIGPGDEMGFDPGVIPGSGNFVMIRKNKSLGQWYGYKIDGVYASQHEINEQGLTEVLGQKIASIRPGDYRFRDQNGDGKITSADLVLLGSGEPDFTGGLTNTVSYKNLSLSVAMQFSYGATVFNANLHSLTSGRDGHNQIAEMNTKSWSPTLYDADGNVFFAGNNEAKYRLPGGAYPIYRRPKSLADGSFLRIGDITLAYALGKKVAKKVGMQNIKLFASVKNLCVFTKYTGFDPEVNTRQGQTGDLMPSLDYSAYPRNRSYSVGFNFIF